MRLNDVHRSVASGRLRLTSAAPGCRLPGLFVFMQSRLERLRAFPGVAGSVLQFLTESDCVLFLELLGRGASSWHGIDRPATRGAAG
jgi:hypothetical protein